MKIHYKAQPLSVYRKTRKWIWAKLNSILKKKYTFKKNITKLIHYITESLYNCLLILHSRGDERMMMFLHYFKKYLHKKIIMINPSKLVLIQITSAKKKELINTYLQITTSIYLI